MCCTWFDEDALYLHLCHLQVGPKLRILPEMQSHQSATHEPETGQYQKNLMWRKLHHLHCKFIFYLTGHFIENKTYNNLKYHSAIYFKLNPYHFKGCFHVSLLRYQNFGRVKTLVEIKTFGRTLLPFQPTKGSIFTNKILMH